MQDQVRAVENEAMEDNLMTPEEMAMLKKLQEKRKAQQKAMGGIKEKLFQDLTTTFGATMAKCKKEVITVATKEAMPDGNIYAITMGIDESDSDGDVDTNALAVNIIENHLAVIEPIMGISNSMKIAGKYEGKDIFWQIRKRS